MQYGVIVFHGEFDPAEVFKLRNHKPVAAFVFDVEDGAMAANDALNRAWKATQNINDYWSLTEEQLYECGFQDPKSDGHRSMILLSPLTLDDFRQPIGHRSSMVGDLMIVSAENRTPVAYTVSRCGFDKIGEIK